MSNNSEYGPTFFVDAMLGNIAKKLRLLGYDTKYSSSIKDDDLIESAKKQGRVVISRDNELINKSKNYNVKSIFITSSSEKDQLTDITNQLNIKKLVVSGSTARCPKCNFHTIPIAKESIKNKIPKGVLDFNDDFWKCENCNQIYWEGTHIRNLQKLAGKINERL